MNTRKKRGKERGREIEEKEMKKTRELIVREFTDEAI
jgi:hypothetical protein